MELTIIEGQVYGCPTSGAPPELLYVECTRCGDIEPFAGRRDFHPEPYICPACEQAEGGPFSYRACAECGEAWLAAPSPGAYICPPCAVALAPDDPMP